MADQPSELHATWVGTDGLTHEVITYKRAGETNGDFAARHAGEVAALLAVFPKAP